MRISKADSFPRRSPGDPLVRRPKMIKPKTRFRVMACAILVAPVAISCATHRVASTPKNDAPKPVVEVAADEETEWMSPALRAKVDRNSRAALAVDADALDTPRSYADQDWLKHSVD